MQKYITILCLFLCCGFSYASSGNIEDRIADVASWVILLLLPFAGIYLFWIVHIYPEKVAENKKHPQLKAIKSMCLLSLIFGGLLWPVALIWANYDYKKDTESSPENEEKPFLDESKTHQEEKSFLEETPLSEETQNHQEQKSC